MANGFVVAAPHSGSGKTIITLGLIRAMRNAGYRIASAKVGPDYIDPQFHAAASGTACMNLDYWAMGPERCAALAHQLGADADLLVIEGVMGLFDGPQGAKGSTADVAKQLELPVVLVVDASHQSQSIAALVQGFCNFDADVKIAGVILNRVKSERHELLLTDALSNIGTPILGALRQSDSLSTPSRHLGLVQAIENQGLEMFLETVAAGVARETKLDKLFQIGTHVSNHTKITQNFMKPLGQNIAIARDQAFAFAYPHILNQWQKAGVQLTFFSPLADQAPEADADAVYLPGGYPELHAGKLADNARFINGLRQHQGLIYGECGGYMVLGDGMIDAKGARHAMAGLLPLETSFAQRKLHLGYRQLKTLTGPLAPAFRGHEFHYASIVTEGAADRLFEATTAAGETLAPCGLKRGNVLGSFAHIICEAP